MASQEKKLKASLSLPELLAETLQCPVCRKTIQDPPVFQCEKGHELCNPCRERIKAEGKPCPVCRGKLTDTRAWAVEKILDKLPKTKCKQDGCAFARSNAQLVKDHEEKECKLRPVKCEHCKQSVALSQLFDHLVANHKKIPLKLAGLEVENFFSFELPVKMTWPIMQWPLRVNNGLEFVLNWRDFNTNLLMLWVSFVGTLKEAKEYKYSIKIISHTEWKKTDRKKDLLSGERECNSCDLSHEDVKESGRSVFLNRALLEEAAGDVNDKDRPEFHLTLVIKKK